jgi:ABC-type maltose transport system permease subunit
MSEQQRVSMPGRLIGVLVVLVIQSIGNGFLGWVLVDELNEDAEHGASVDGAGLFYFLGYLSIALSVLMVVCVVLTVRPRVWVRPVIITIEAFAVINGVINLFNGAVAGLLGIVIAGVVIAVLLSEDVMDWYRR